MGKYKAAKYKNPPAKRVKPQQEESVAEPVEVVSVEKGKNKIIFLIIIALAFILYGNTVGHDYALDDAIVITQNEFTKKGISGIGDIFGTETFTGFFGRQKNLVAGSRYRPLSLVSFALEVELLGQNPHVSHFINILLYGLMCILIFRILSRVFSEYKPARWYLSFPFIVTLLFLTHPIHTEAIANIKGRDEIFTMLGSLLALWYSLKYVDTSKIKYLVFSGVAFFLALISKENAITFLVIIPLTLYYFTSTSLKRIFFTTLPLIAGIALLFIVRNMVLGSLLGSGTSEIAKELMNDSFLHATTAEKFATIVYTMGVYLKLLIFPHPLTFDYYPYHIRLMKWSDPAVILSLLVNIGLILFAVFSFVKIVLKKKTKQSAQSGIISYSVLFYFITFSIVSNILFPIGTFMNERFMFFSSLGFCLILAYLVVNKFRSWVKSEKHYLVIVLVILIPILSAYSWKSIDRNKAWRNDFTLFTTDVHVSDNSAKSNTSAGGKLSEEAEKLQKIGDSHLLTVEACKKELHSKTLLSDDQIETLVDVSDTAQVKANIDKMADEFFTTSIKYLTKAVDEIHPKYADALLLLGNAWFNHKKDYDKTVHYYSRILKQNPNFDKVFSNMEIIFARYNDVDHKIKLYLELYQLSPDRFEVNYNLGRLYGMGKNDLDKAIFYLERAIKQKPKDKLAYKDLGVAYGIKGRFEDAITVLDKAIKLDPKDSQLYVNLGVSYQNIGNIEMANQSFAKAKELNPEGNK